MNPEFHFIVEGSREIGLGHVFMTLALIEECHASRFAGTTVFTIGELARDVLLEYDICPVHPFSEWQRHVHVNSCAFINVRMPENMDLESLHGDCRAIAVTDEFGRQKLRADFLHNPTPVANWYRPSDEYRRVFYGLDYFVMRRDFLHSIGHEKPAAVSEKRVLVIMGGVDRTGATLHLAPALLRLAELLPLQVTIVMGPGFVHEPALRSILDGCPREWVLLSNPADLPEIMQRHDLLLSAGGNLLFEAASLGLPSLVFWEDWHEQLRGDAAEALGFARCIGRGFDVDSEIAFKAIQDALCDITWLRQAEGAGRLSVDGRGARRLLDGLAEVLT